MICESMYFPAYSETRDSKFAAIHYCVFFAARALLQSSEGIQIIPARFMLAIFSNSSIGFCVSGFCPLRPAALWFTRLWSVYLPHAGLLPLGGLILSDCLCAAACPFSTFALHSLLGALCFLEINRPK
jgi:hypothetical protein